jgi:hypothetical protein
MTFRSSPPLYLSLLTDANILMITLPVVFVTFASLSSAAMLPHTAPATYKLRTHVLTGNQTLHGLYSADAQVLSMAFKLEVPIDDQPHS